MVTQKSRFNFFLTDMFINCLVLLSLCSSDILSICEQFSHLYVQAATQNFFITHFNLSINQFEVGQSDIKSGSHSVSHFMFSHCESVSYFMFSICQSVSESFYVQSLSVSQWVIYVQLLSVSEWVILCSVTQSVSESFMFLIICQSVSQWVIYVPHHLSVSESVSHFMFSICQSVSESFYVQYLSVSRLVILCSVSVCQSVSQSFYVQYLSVSQSVILCSVSLSRSVSQLVNYLIRQKDTERNSQINKLTKLDRQKDTQTKRLFSVHQSVT